MQGLQGFGGGSFPAHHHGGGGFPPHPHGGSPFVGSEPQGPAPVVTAICNFIPDQLADEELSVLFEPFQPLSVKLVRDRAGNSLGYAFIDFSTRPQADAAIQSLNGLQVYNKRLKLTLARPREELDKNTNVYLSSVPLCWEGREDVLRQLGSHIGEIIELRLLPKLPGHRSLSAFIRYNRRAESDMALAILDGFPVSASSPDLILLPDPSDPDLPSKKVMLSMSAGVQTLSAKYAADTRSRAKANKEAMATLQQQIEEQLLSSGEAGIFLAAAPGGGVGAASGGPGAGTVPAPMTRPAVGSAPVLVAGSGAGSRVTPMVVPSGVATAAIMRAQQNLARIQQQQHSQQSQAAGGVGTSGAAEYYDNHRVEHSTATSVDQYVGSVGAVNASRRLPFVGGAPSMYQQQQQQQQQQHQQYSPFRRGSQDYQPFGSGGGGAGGVGGGSPVIPGGLGAAQKNLPLEVLPIPPLGPTGAYQLPQNLAGGAAAATRSRSSSILSSDSAGGGTSGSGNGSNGNPISAAAYGLDERQHHQYQQQQQQQYAAQGLQGGIFYQQQQHQHQHQQQHQQQQSAAPTPGIAQHHQHSYGLPSTRPQIPTPLFHAGFAISGPGVGGAPPRGGSPARPATIDHYLAAAAVLPPAYGGAGIPPMAPGVAAASTLAAAQKAAMGLALLGLQQQPQQQQQQYQPQQQLPLALIQAPPPATALQQLIPSSVIQSSLFGATGLNTAAGSRYMTPPWQSPAVSRAEGGAEAQPQGGSPLQQSAAGTPRDSRGSDTVLEEDDDPRPAAEQGETGATMGAGAKSFASKAFSPGPRGLEGTVAGMGMVMSGLSSRRNLSPRASQPLSLEEERRQIAAALATPPRAVATTSAGAWVPASGGSSDSATSDYRSSYNSVESSFSRGSVGEGRYSRQDEESPAAPFVAPSISRAPPGYLSSLSRSLDAAAAPWPLGAGAPSSASSVGSTSTPRTSSLAGTPERGTVAVDNTDPFLLAQALSLQVSGAAGDAGATAAATTAAAQHERVSQPHQNQNPHPHTIDITRAPSAALAGPLPSSSSSSAADEPTANQPMVIPYQGFRHSAGEIEPALATSFNENYNEWLSSGFGFGAGSGKGISLLGFRTAPASYHQAEEGEGEAGLRGAAAPSSATQREEEEDSQMLSLVGKLAGLAMIEPSGAPPSSSTPSPPGQPLSSSDPSAAAGAGPGGKGQQHPQQQGSLILRHSKSLTEGDEVEGQRTPSTEKATEVSLPSAASTGQQTRESPTATTHH